MHVNHISTAVGSCAGGGGGGGSSGEQCRKVNTRGQFGELA